ncbi:MAG: hypothetical protein IPJ36_09990 [Simplicispira sp.]|nr:hypothetical protein [Simplicispira sp.]
MACPCRRCRCESFARLANKHLPELKTHDRYGNRIDWVEFHPAWHELMALAWKHEVLVEGTSLGTHRTSRGLCSRNFGIRRRGLMPHRHGLARNMRSSNWKPALKIRPIVSRTQY